MQKRKVNFVNFRNNLTDYVNKTSYGGERVVVTRHGKEIGAFVTLDDLRAIERLEEQLELEAYDRGLKEIEKHGTISQEELDKELGWDEL